MREKKKTFQINFSDALLLFGYYWSAVNSAVGDLGEISYEEMVSEVGKQSHIHVTRGQLAHLIYHMKQAIFEKLPSYHVELLPLRYNHIMRRLMRDVPDLFENAPSGEIVMTQKEDD